MASSLFFGCAQSRTASMRHPPALAQLFIDTGRIAIREAAKKTDRKEL